MSQAEHFDAQIRLILSDQQRELREVREDRRAAIRKQAELDAREIDVLLGIAQTKAVMCEVTMELTTSDGVITIEEGR